MTSREFLQAVSNGKADILDIVLTILHETKTPYCIIGGLAVNAYAEPVVSLDLDVVIAAENIELICAAVRNYGLETEVFQHSINLKSPKSDLRVQIQTDERYQAFIPLARPGEVLGYNMQIARLEDVLKGKIWAYQDEARRKSKRQKDLADIARLIEAFPEMTSSLPQEVRKHIE